MHQRREKAQEALIARRQLDAKIAQVFEEHNNIPSNFKPLLAGLFKRFWDAGVQHEREIQQAMNEDFCFSEQGRVL